jgi:hypothetical protein
MSNNKISLFLPLSVTLFLIGGSPYLMMVGPVPLQIHKAAAQNYNTTAASGFPPSTSTNNQTNSSITLGNPIFGTR